MTFHAIDIALTQLGVYEQTGDNDGIPAERYMRGDPLAWCMGFALWCFDTSDDPDIWDDDGEELDEDDRDYWKLRNCKTAWRYLGQRGLTFGPMIVPMPNDLVFFNARGDSDAGEGWHVGLVSRAALLYEGFEQHAIPQWGCAARFETVEGNVSNQVGERAYFLGDPTIIGFGRICPTPMRVGRMDVRR